MIKLGEQIAKLRKSKGMTQEQLAAAVGVSSPAVSKWETNTSCPDIALLCPIARTLGVNVDQLLQFEETLTKDEQIKCMNEIVEVARKGNLEEAEDMLLNLLHTYPSDIVLKYNMALVLNTFQMFFPLASEEKSRSWREQKKQLLESVRTAKTVGYWEKALASLAGIAMQEEQLEQAEALLKELPEHSTEHFLLWSQYYLKMNNQEKALEVTQKRLYTLTYQLQMCLVTMMNEKMISDPVRNLELCKVYRQLEQIFNVGGETIEGLFVEAYKRMANYEEAKNSLIRMIDQLIGTAQQPNPILFDPTIKIEKGQAVATKEMKRIMLEGIEQEEFLKDFLEDEELQRAIDRLKQNMNL